MQNIKSLFYELAETFAVSIIVIYLIYTFVASMEVVTGESMEPAFLDGERILVDKVTPYYNDYSRGEVIVLEPPIDENKHYIKRVLGVPGDVFKILDCVVYISNTDGKFLLEEPYLAEGTCTGGGLKIQEGRSIKLGEGEYIVLGDNRDHSIDSRFFGVVTKSDIIGRVVFVFWPPDKIGFIK